MKKKKKIKPQMIPSTWDIAMENWKKIGIYAEGVFQNASGFNLTELLWRDYSPGEMAL